VEKASEAYFNKSAADLTLNEAALLAALVKKPEGYLLGADADAASPYLPLAKLQPLMRRQRQVIETLRKIGWISEEEFQASATQPLRARRPRADAGAAPYYVQQVMKELKELLAGSRISGRGYRVYTALDPRQQAKAEELAARIAKEHREAGQAALVAIEPQTGFVRALVGGVNYRLSQFNRATQALRQPGSAFKPILYATALEQGFTPRSVFLDEPVRFAWAGAGKTFERRQVQGMLASAVAGEPFDDPGALAGGGPPEAEGQYYEPHNFGDRYGLPSLIPETAQMAEDRHMTLGRALELSSNVIAVQLLDQVGLRRVAAQAQRWNIPLRPEAGLCAALGCSETTLLSLTAAYAAFANGGLTVRPVFIKRVTNNNGDVLFENSPDFPNPVISPWTAFEMRKLLQGVIERGTGARARIGREAGGKTGTNDGPRDTWFIGFTPSLVAGVWIGNDDNRPMPSEQGGRTTARMWAEFMRAAPVPGGGEQFPEPPDKYAGLRICNLDGQVSQPNCPDTGTYYFRESELSPEVFAGALAETAPAPREEPLAPENSAPSPAPRSPDVTFPPAPRSAPPD
jgi:penicillin-binding protein 1A